MTQWKTCAVILSIFLLAAASAGFNLFLARAETSTTSVGIRIAQCSDGIDNDLDGLIDYPADPDCTSSFDDNEGPHVIVPPEPTSTPPGGGGSGWYGGGGGGTGTSTESGFPLFPPPPTQQSLPAKILRTCDFNGDGSCNIIDLSILLYYMNQPMPFSARYDLNDDGTIDILDISIFFYYWK